MIGLKRISRVLMNMVGWTIYRALMFFLYLKSTTKRSTDQFHLPPIDAQVVGFGTAFLIVHEQQQV